LRGVGEVPVVPTMAAIANAIGAATGLRPRSLPMSPPRLLKWLDEAAAGGA
jgi:CO/xanthine dehydrogenase Mo-binding subunit